LINVGPICLATIGMVRELCLRPQIAKVWAVVSLSVGRAGSPCNIMWPGPRPTFVPSGVLIHANQQCLDLCGVFHAARKQVSAALCTSPQNHSRLGRFCMHAAECCEELRSVAYPYVSAHVREYLHHSAPHSVALTSHGCNTTRATFWAPRCENQF